MPRALAEAEPFIGRIHGFGLDSSERGHPPSKFSRLFARCRALGLPVVAHAGEEGPPAYITEALDILGARRIDHGVRAPEDPAVLARWPARACRSPSVRSPTPGCACLPRWPSTALRLIAAGARVTLNSDDPAYFGRLSQRQHPRGAGRLRLRRRHPGTGWPATASRRALRATPKAGWIARLDAYFAAAGVPLSWVDHQKAGEQRNVDTTDDHADADDGRAVEHLLEEKVPGQRDEGDPRADQIAYTTPTGSTSRVRDSR